MIQFDKTTLSIWGKNGVKTISCTFREGGCEGTELHILEGEIRGNKKMEVLGSNIECYISEKDVSVLDGSFITHTNGKWILSSKNILTHCGCGKSFKIKTGNPKIDKFLLLKSEHEKKNHAHH